MQANTTSHEVTSVSRRSFFRLAMGSITMLPTVASALALAPQAALADEQDIPRASLASSSTIYVVKPAELGLVVRDVTIENGAANLIKGARVRITSRFNGKVLEDVTDDEGKVHFDISGLAEDDGKAETIPTYAFNATIEVSAQGYREFCTSLIRVEGGTALGIPTQPRQAGLPYPVSTSFDGWDVLYSDGDSSTFVRAQSNDANHTVGLTLDDCPAGATVTAGIFADGKRVAKTSAKADADGRASFEIADEFLRTGGSAALPSGDDHEYSMRYIVGNTTYEVPIKLTVMEAPEEAQKEQNKKDLELSPFGDASMFLGISVPKDWPVIGGAKIKLWRPSFFADFCYDPFGFILVRVTSPEIGYSYKKDSGKPAEKGWDMFPREWPQKQFMKTLDTMATNTAQTLGALDDKKTFKQIGFTNKFSFTAQAIFMAAAQWEFGDKESRGRAQLSLRVGANYSLCEQFWAGPFPFIIRFSVGLSAMASGQVGYISPSVWKFSQYRWDWSSTGIDVQVCFNPTLSVGVGINGVASMSVKGCFSLTFSEHLGPLPDGYEYLPNPHLRLAGKASCTAEAEVLWFTKTWKIWESDWPDWYNNWDDYLKPTKLQAEPAGFTSELEGKSLQEAYEGASIISAGDLEGLAEFETGGLAAMAPQEKCLQGYTLFEKTADGTRAVASMYLNEERLYALEGRSDVKLEAASDDEAAKQDERADSQVVVLGGAAQDAGEGATLAAQDDDADVSYILRPSNAELTYYEAEAADASAVGDHEYVEIADERPGVLRLGLEQGFRPTADIRMAQNILLPQRQRLFTVGDTDYIARIGAVKVAGQVRTRVICSQVNGSGRRVLDFVSNYNRDNCFDYDFDIITTRVDGADIVNMVVISGERAMGDGTSLAQAATSTYFNFVSCRDWTAGSFSALTVIGAGLDTLGDGGKTYPFRCYSCPRLVQIKGERDGHEYSATVVTYLERASRFEYAIMGDDPDLTRAGVGLVFFPDRIEDGLYTDSLDVMRPFNNQVLADPSITGVEISGRADGYQMLEVTGGRQTYYALLETDPCWYIYKSGKAMPRLLGARLVDLGEAAGKITRLISMEGGAYFLACVDGLLKRVDVMPGDKDGTPTLEYADFGSEELNMSDFGVLENGDVLYWPASREDGGYTFEGEGNDDATLREGEDGALNLIMAARVRGGELSKAFALCEVGHPISHIRTFGNSDDHMSFISANTVDLATGTGELWYTSVPWVRCANLLEATPYATLVAKGDQLPFYVTLKNDGNVYLSGVELTVAEVGGAAIGTVELSFGEDAIVASEHNPRGDDGQIQGLEPDFALAPGTTSRYLAPAVTVPEDWEGEHEVEIFVTAVRGATVSAEGLLAAQVEDSSIEFIPDQRMKAGLKLGSNELVIEEQGEFGRADVSVVRGGKSGGGKSGGKQGSGSKSGGKASGSGSSAGKKSSGSKSGSSQGSGSKGSQAASGNQTTTTTARSSSTPSTGDATDAYKRGSMPTTGDPAQLSAAAAIALGGAASIAAAKALRDKGDGAE